MGDAGTSCQINNLIAVQLVAVETILAIDSELFLTNVAKEGSQAVIVVERPVVKRVVMTTGALKPNAQKHLGDGFGGGVRIAIGAIETRRRIRPRRALRREQLADERAQGGVGGDLITQPALEDPDAFRTHRLFFVAQQVRPF